MIGTLLRAWKETGEAAKTLDPAILADGVSEQERAAIVFEGREAIKSLETALRWLEQAA